MREYRFEIWQGRMIVAEGSGGDLDAVRREALHYAMIYAQDGEVQIKSPDFDELFGKSLRGVAGTEGGR